MMLGEEKKKSPILLKGRKKILIDGTSFCEEMVNFHFNFFSDDSC
jgi:hypothetical protein